ncbi:MAG TPA: choice-of-anchor L domain-containing protein [Dehalococcoidia bacterium]|nr:choice-of-anchor L domain-containing protein [Dehalococcoidia bacterium]
MPKLYHRLLFCAALAVVLLCAALADSGHKEQAEASGGLTTNELGDFLSPLDLANELVGNGIAISNVEYTGSYAAAGTFSGGTGIIGFESGIVLSSGWISNVVGPNLDSGITGVNDEGGDADLTQLSGFDTFDASVLEFDFVPDASPVSFQYVFASDEYNEFVHTEFNDVFAFLINGTNCATVPGGPVSINTINGGNPFGTAPMENPSLFRDNEGTLTAPTINTEMDGLTTVLNCQAPVAAHERNHMKLAIADASDDALDSDVFLKVGSFIPGTPQPSGSTQTSTPTRTPTRTPSPTPSPTRTPTRTPTATPTVAAVSSTPTATATATPTIAPTPTPTLLPPVTETPFETETPTATPSPAPTPTPTATASATPTPVHTTPPPTQAPTAFVTQPPTPTPTITLGAATATPRTSAEASSATPSTSRTPTPIVGGQTTPSVTPKPSLPPTQLPESTGPTGDGSNPGSNTTGGGGGNGRYRPDFSKSTLSVGSIDTKAGVLSTNAALAVITLMLLVLTAEVFNKTVEENQDTLKRWFAWIFGPIERAGERIGAAWNASAGQSFLGVIGAPLAVLLIAGALYGFSQPGFGFNTESLVLFISIVATVGIITYFYNGGQILVTKRFGMNAAVRIFPAGVLVLAACIIFTRIDGFQPGIIYGFIATAIFLGGAEPDKRQNGQIIFYPVMALLGLCLVAWLLLSPARDLANDHSGWLSALPEGIAVGVFVGGLEGTFFQMIPIRYMDGHKIYSWNKAAWALAAGATAFMVWEILLNKERSNVSAISSGTPLVVIIAMAICAFLSFAFYGFFRFRNEVLGAEAEA